MIPRYFLNDPTIILSTLFFMIFIILKKCVGLPGDPVVAPENHLYHREASKTMGIYVDNDSFDELDQ